MEYKSIPIQLDLQTNTLTIPTNKKKLGRINEKAVHVPKRRYKYSSMCSLFVFFFSSYVSVCVFVCLYTLCACVRLYDLLGLQSVFNLHFIACINNHKCIPNMQ